MRRALWILGFSLAASGILRADPVTFIRVWPGWYDADSFKRISEYFTGVENTAGWIVRRTDQESRAGFYFLVRVKNTGPALAGAKFVLQVVTPAGPDPETFAFSADIPHGSRVFDLGLTGADWPGKRVHPVAWRLDLFTADGTALTGQQSFLWAMPSR